MFFIYLFIYFKFNIALLYVIKYLNKKNWICKVSIMFKIKLNIQKIKKKLLTKINKLILQYWFDKSKIDKFF